MKTKLTLIMLIAGYLCAEAQSWTWLEDQLTFARDGLSATTLDDSIFYSGGRIDNGVFYNIVEIYDAGEQVWKDMVQLESTARWQTSAASGGGKVFFAGGNNYGVTNPTFYNIIDVWTKETGDWTIDSLSEARALIATVTAGNKVFFAGGWKFNNPYPGGGFEVFDEIDIYDTETGLWDTVYLSVPRCLIGAAAAGNMVFFAGGNTASGEVTDVVDIYNVEDEIWEESITLSEPRAMTAAVTYRDSLVYFAGGTLPNQTGSDVIDIYNVVLEEWEDAKSLSVPRIVTAYNVYDALVFTGVSDYYNIDTYGAGPPNGVVDIYYPETGEWDYSVPDLDPARYFFAHASYANRIYFAGGQFGEYFNTINILDYDYIPGFSKNKFQELEICVHPNPFTTSLRIDFNLQHPGNIKLSIYNNIGKQVEVLKNDYQQQGDQQVIFNAGKLKPGIYFCVLKTSEGIQSKKIIKL